MSHIHKIIVIMMIFLNFFGVLILIDIGLWWDTIVSKNIFFESSFIELIVVFTMIFTLSFLFNVRRSRNIDKIKYRRDLKNKLIIYGLYFFFFLSAISSINWSFNNEMKGVGQFELSNRAGFFQLVTLFAYPYLVFVYHYDLFNKRTKLLSILLGLVIVLGSVSSGGRAELAFIMISGIIYLAFYSNLTIKYLFYSGSVSFVLMSLSVLLRSSFINSDSFFDNGLASIFQANSDPSFLWQVKAYKLYGITLLPENFMMHFVSLLIPSFIYIQLFGELSYIRSTFLFDSLYNTNSNNGLDFMLLADFYWCFGEFGYLLFIGFISFCFYIFKRNIYSIKPYKFISVIFLMVFICKQRNDFGAVLKPAVYTFLFLYILDYLLRLRLKK